MASYTYTDLGTITDDTMGQAQVRGLHHPADDGRAASYEVRIDASVQLDLADPAQREQIETLIRALQVAVANGEAVGWTGSVPGDVRVKTPATVEWTATLPSGSSMTVSAP